MARLVYLCVMALFCASCGIFGPSKNTDQDFSATLDPDTANVHQFTVKRNGEVRVRITALSNPNVILSLHVGQLVGFECTPIIFYVQPVAVLGREALNAAINEGNYCLQMTDPGTLVEPVDYTVRVSHP